MSNVRELKGGERLIAIIGGWSMFDVPGSKPLEIDHKKAVEITQYVEGLQRRVAELEQEKAERGGRYKGFFK